MFDSNGMSRRSFLVRAGAGVAAGAAPLFVPSRAFGANDRVNVAVVGVRGQGGGHLNSFSRLENVHVHTIVDVDQNVLARRGRETQERVGYASKLVTDMRRAFDDPEIDAVSFATPNHWHALGSIWAVQAGKHVYVEKPSSHTIWEGRQMVNAARRYDRLIQVGFQNRSRTNTRAAIKLLHDGGIGKVYMGRGLCHKPRGNIGRYPDGPMRADERVALTIGSPSNETPWTADYLRNVDYDMWIGPAEVRPFNRNRFHYNWHWQWEYGNGDTGNQGPHQLDVGRWGLNKHEYPVKIRSMGGYYGYTDSDQTTPNTQTTLFEYADGTLFEFSTRGLQTNAEGGVMIGNIFYGSEGRLEMDDGGNWKTFMGRSSEPGLDSATVTGEGYSGQFAVANIAGGHYGNFVSAVRSGSRADLTCDIEEGHRSSTLASMGNISYLLGREVRTDGHENFTGDAEANAMMKGKYRAPYVVPDLG
jgi:predicted dehydrogenase